MSPPKPGLSRICYSEGIKKDHIHLFRAWAKKKEAKLDFKIPHQEPNIPLLFVSFVKNNFRYFGPFSSKVCEIQHFMQGSPSFEQTKLKTVVIILLYNHLLSSGLRHIFISFTTGKGVLS